ncbi:unnamed protein product [Alopecurus aequalis]
MEDLVVGLAKSVVQGALTKVQSAIEEDEKLRQRAQSNLAFMTVEFEMMQSFLDVANKEENVKNKLVATWVRHVRKVAYDVQDCIELVIHLDDAPTWWRRLLPGCWRGPMPLDVAVAEIEQLKARVEDVSKCYTRYNLINDSGSRLVMMQQPASRATAGDMLVEARQATKRQQRFGDLTQLISKADNDLQVISVWGVGGDHGTTSIIRKAYNDPDICQKFPCRSWVKLMRPFNPDKFVRCFMAQYYANSCQEQGSIGVHVRMKMKATQDELFEEFMKQLNNRYLIVLENLSNMVDWDAIRTFLPHKKDGSRIILSTQQPEVASLCVGHSYQLSELKKFSDEHSVCAFFEKSSHDDGHNFPSYKDNDDKLSGEPKLSHQGVTLIHTKGSSSGLSTSDKLKKNSEISLIARGSEMKDLLKYTALVRINSSQVTAVWGMPGVGKSAIARNLYNEKMDHSDQFIKYGWVDVSHPFNLRDFSASLLLGFHSKSLRPKDAYRVTMGTKDPIQECRNFLSKYPCFVVLNNLQSTEEWDLIEDSLVSRPSTSVIVVLTNEAGTAAHCARSKEDVLNVKGLEADAAFSLFKKEVQRESGRGPESKLPLSDNHEGLGELILRCGGLPIVIAAIARSLAKEMTDIKWKSIIASMNEGFMEELETKPQFHNLRGLFGWMHSYIGNCLDFLKPCILYMSIFPPEQTIRRRRLVRRWISEGYSKESSRRSLEDHGEELFSSLVNMSIIQQPPQSAATASSDTRMVRCQVNRFLYEYIISRQKEENLVFQLGKGRSISTQCTWHHLTIWKQWNRDQIVFESINLSRLRSLTVFGDWEPFFISKTMKLLRVLDLENASGVTDGDLEQMVKLLHRLKFLSLRGCTEICNLPSSLGGLRQLQSLDIRHTSIVTLPAKITKLKKLQYIRAGTIVQAETPSAPCLPTSQFPGMRGCGRIVGVKVPRGLGKIKALHTLGVINVGASRGKGVMKQLEKLTQLHKLGVSGITRRNSRRFFSVISGHGHLASLSVRLKKGNKHCLDDISLPWEKLESLKLYGFGNKLPLTKRSPEEDDQLPGPRPSSPLPQEEQLQAPRPSPMSQVELAVSTIKPRFLHALQSFSASSPRAPPQDEAPVPQPPLHQDEELPSDQVASSQVKKLMKLVLEMDTLTKGDMKFLAELPHLCILRLRVKESKLLFMAKMSGLELSTFTKVKILEIACNSSSHVTFGSETMKQLVVLKLDLSGGPPSCRISGLNHLPELKEVLLKGDIDEKVKTDLQEQLANHPNKPVVRLEEQPRTS